jgi:hypothetical protein
MGIGSDLQGRVGVHEAGCHDSWHGFTCAICYVTKSRSPHSPFPPPTTPPNSALNASPPRSGAFQAHHFRCSPFIVHCALFVEVGVVAGSGSPSPRPATTGPCSLPPLPLSLQRPSAAASEAQGRKEGSQERRRCHWKIGRIGSRFCGAGRGVQPGEQRSLWIGAPRRWSARSGLHSPVWEAMPVWMS